MDAVVGLGANLGARAETFASALRALSRVAEVVAASALWETPAVGPPQPPYLNAAVRIRSTLEPRALLDQLLQIERAHGRVRRERWGPRTLDLDLLFVAGVVLNEPDLTLPHARLLERAFALMPLLEVAPEAVHPGTGKRLSLSVPQLTPTEMRFVAGPEWAVSAE